MKKQPFTIGIDASRAFEKDKAGPEYYSWHLIKNLAEIDKNNRYTLYIRQNQKVDIPLPRNFRVKVIYPNRFWTQLGLACETLINPPRVLFIPAHTLPLLTRAVYGVGNWLKVLPQMSILVTIHGLEGKYLPQHNNFLAHIHRNWSIDWSVRFSHFLIAVSNNTYKEVLNTYKLPIKYIKVVHEGVDFDRYAKNRRNVKKVLEKYHIANNYILFIGTLQPRKNLVRLIKAFSILSGKYQSLQLVIAGKKGWLYDKIMRAPKLYGVENRVVFTGRIADSDLPGLYRGSQAFVLPSITEGFGLPVLEAQASGVPVICSDTGALREVAGDGALFVNPLKTEDISQKIDKIFKDKILRDKLVKNGVKNAKKLSWTNTAYNTLKIINKLAG